ncbi:MAG: hypothetical protein R3E39_15410 [Anaerolineae bacterium]
MNTTASHRPLLPLLLLSLCLVFLGINGFLGGYAMISDPRGAPMGMPVSTLQNTLFQDFFIPGLCLIVIWGCGSLLTLAGLWLRPHWLGLDTLSRLVHEHWSWEFSVLLGAGLLVWLSYQVFTLPEVAPIQIILFVLAALLVMLPLLPPMRRYYHT